MPILAESPIDTLQEPTRRVRRPARLPRVQPAQLALARLSDGVDAFADRLIALVFTAGTAQALE